MKLEDVRKHHGFTLTELIVSMGIGTLLLLMVFSLLRAGVNGYKQVSNGVEESANMRSAREWIQEDLKHIVLRLPVSYGKGSSDLGWDLAKGLYTDWDASYSYGQHFPSESSKGFPSDRLGFFITLSDETAEAYDGKNIAHVLYFTAITKDVQSEDIEQDFIPDSTGYSRKLFRYFTPPDRVYERLNLINPNQGGGLTSRGSAAIPRGPNYVSTPCENDDESWGLDTTLSPSVLSLVASDVVQFEITLNCILRTLNGSEPAEMIEDFSTSYNAEGAVKARFSEGLPNIPENFHALLESTSKEGTHHLIPNHLLFQMKVCPYSAARTLTASEWNVSINGKYLARENILPTQVSFKSTLNP